MAGNTASNQIIFEDDLQQPNRIIQDDDIHDVYSEEVNRGGDENPGIDKGKLPSLEFYDLGNQERRMKKIPGYAYGLRVFDTEDPEKN